MDKRVTKADSMISCHAYLWITLFYRENEHREQTVFTHWELQLFQSTVNVKLLSWEKYASSNYRQDRGRTASKGQTLLLLCEMLSFLLYKYDHTSYTKPFALTVSSVKSVELHCPSSVLLAYQGQACCMEALKKSGIRLVTQDVPTIEQWTHHLIVSGCQLHLLSSSAVFSSFSVWWEERWGWNV